MAVAIGTPERSVTGNRRIVNVPITGPASYTTGGELLTKADLCRLMPELFSDSIAITVADVAKIEFFKSEQTPAASPVYIILDRPNMKMMYYNGAVQVANATNLSGITINVEITYMLQPTA